MKRLAFVLLLALAGGSNTPAQNLPFVIDTAAGRFDIGDGGPADEARLAEPRGLAQDAQGNLYVAEREHHRVRKITPTGEISTVAGNGISGFGGDDGPAVDAQFFSPFDVAVDGDGNIHISDTGNHRIRRVDAATGIITTFAGTGATGFAGDGGPATAATLFAPEGICFDANGNLLIADFANSRVRSVDGAAGTITTIAGTGTIGSLGDDGPATAAQLSFPTDVAVAPAGSPIAGAILISEEGNSDVRIIENGIITKFAGTGVFGFVGNGGPATAADLRAPQGVDTDVEGNVYIADTSNHVVRRVNPAGIIDAFIGVGFGFSGDGGPAENAGLDSPSAILVGNDGTLFVSDTSNQRIRAVLDGVIDTAAGRSNATGDGGPATEAELYSPLGVAVDGDDNLLIADFRNHRLRKVTFNSPGTMSTLAGRDPRGFAGDGGPANLAGMNFPYDVAADGNGNIYIAETTSSRIRKIDTANVITTVAGNGTLGFGGDGGPATDAAFRFPRGVFAAADGSIYIADLANHRIRKVDAGGIITTIAGTGVFGFSGDGGPATSAQLTSPSYVFADSEGYVFFSSAVNGRIRVISPSGDIQTVVGTGQFDFNGDGLPALETNLNAPTGIAVDADRNLYFAESGGHRIRMTPLAPVGALGGQTKQLVAGNVVTIAGNGQAGFGGDRGLSTDANINNPQGLALDSKGRLYFSDSSNHRIRVLDPTLPLATGAGVVNGASFANLLSPAVIASAFVLNGAEQDAVATTDPLPTDLGGATLEITDSQGATRQSGIFGIFNNQRQINFFIDPETALGPATLTLRRADGEASTAAIDIQLVAPGVFFINNAQAQPVALANFLRFRGADFTVGNTFTNSFDLEPIDLGDEQDQVFLSLFVTGIQFASGVAGMSATIDGEDVPVFSFVGDLDQFVGLGQVNVGPIPRSFVGRGPVLIVLSVDGFATNSVMVAFL
jgi:uncharacterized protein (TIGR03437 family)